MQSDPIWLFLDKARKVGAELGVGGDNSRRNWARVSVDDLMLVRGELILPHVSRCLVITNITCSN
jgi:protein FAM50